MRIISVPGRQKNILAHAREPERKLFEQNMKVILNKLSFCFIFLLFCFKMFFKPWQKFKRSNHCLNDSSVVCNCFFNNYFLPTKLIDLKWNRDQEYGGLDENVKGLQGKPELVCQETLTTQSLRPLLPCLWFHYRGSDKISQWHPAPLHLQEANTET